MTSLSIDIIDPEYVDTFLRWRCRTNYVDPLDNSNLNEDELDAVILSYLNLHK